MSNVNKTKLMEEIVTVNSLLNGKWYKAFKNPSATRLFYSIAPSVSPRLGIFP